MTETTMTEIAMTIGIGCGFLGVSVSCYLDDKGFKSGVCLIGGLLSAITIDLIAMLIINCFVN